tara:strand:- start:404 stop:949 length:546 start_codon:yes stop_codon:yes gene_type:complete
MPSCEDNEVEEQIVEEEIVPSIQLLVNGTPINAYEYYAEVNTYGEKVLGEDGKIKKLFVLHLQREEGRVLPTLEHYAAIWYDESGIDNDQLIDPGIYLGGPYAEVQDTYDDKKIKLEIIGADDYTEAAQSQIYEYDDNRISGFADGYFYNPYRDEMQHGLVIFENVEIGTDTSKTFYSGEF